MPTLSSNAVEVNPRDPLESQKENKRSDNALVALVVDRFNQWRGARAIMEKKWDEYYRIWQCLDDMQDKTRESERSTIKIPASKEAVNNSVDSMFQIIFDSVPYFKISPRVSDLAGMDAQQASMEVEIRSMKARKIQKYMKFLLHREKFPRKIYEALLDWSVYGTCIGRIKPNAEKTITLKKEFHSVIGQNGNVLDRIPTGGAVSAEQMVIHPEFEHIWMPNFYIDPVASSIDSAEGVIIRSYKKRFEMEELKAAGVIDNMPSETITPPSDYDLRSRHIIKSGIAMFNKDDDVEILEYWGWVKRETLEKMNVPVEDGKDGQEMVLIIANKSELLMAAKNPFYSGKRPFVVGRFETCPGEFYGRGVIANAYGPQKALDATVRNRLDNKALSVNQMFGINIDNFLPGQNLKTYPGKAFLFHGDPGKSLQPLIVPDVTGGSYQEAAEYERYIQGAHGISRIIGGQSMKQGEQTATEISASLQQSGARIKRLVKSFEEDFLMPIYQWYVRISLQWLSETEIFTVFDDKTGAPMFADISPQDISADYDFFAMGSVSLAAQNDLQKRMNLLQVFGGNPMFSQFVNWPYFMRKIYESMNLDDIDAALMSQVPPQQIVAMALQQAQGGKGIPMMSQANQYPGVPGQTAPPSDMQGRMVPNMPNGQTNGPSQPGSMLSPSNNFGGMPSAAGQ